MEEEDQYSVLQPWHNDVSLEFIEIYKRERAIWDPKHWHHKNRVELNAAWARVQEAMRQIGVESTIAELKKKKESLMSSFRLQCTKKNRESNYEPSWYAFSALYSFLGQVYKPDTVASTSNNQQSFNSPSPDGDHEYAQNPTTIAETYRASKLKKRERLRHSEDIANPVTFYSKKRLQEANTSMSRTRDRSEMDECELYCALLARKLRRLNEDQRDLAMHEIDNIVFKIKISSPASQRKVKSPSPIFIVAPRNHESYNEDDDVKFLEDPIDDED